MTLTDLTTWVGKAAFSVLSSMVFILGLNMMNENFTTAGLFPLFFTGITVFVLGYSIKRSFWGSLAITGVSMVLGFLGIFFAGIILSMYGVSREIFISGSYAFSIAVMLGVAVDFLKEKGEAYKVSRAHNFFSGILQFGMFWSLYMYIIRDI